MVPSAIGMPDPFSGDSPFPRLRPELGGHLAGDVGGDRAVSGQVSWLVEELRQHRETDGDVDRTLGDRSGVAAKICDGEVRPELILVCDPSACCRANRLRRSRISWQWTGSRP